MSATAVESGQHKTEIVEQPRAFKVPMPELGEQVKWYPHGSDKNPPHIAFVTKLGHDSVCLSILHPNSHNFMLRDGVRHHKDPKARQAELVEQGGWGETPAKLRLIQLEELVGKLSKVL